MRRARGGHEPDVERDPAADVSSQWTPSVPSTFAISCGSATTTVVPNGSTSCANSSTRSFDDSRCMGVDEPRHDVAVARVDRRGTFVIAQAGHESVDDGDVDLDTRANVEKTGHPHDESAARPRGRRRCGAKAARPSGQEPYSCAMDVLAANSTRRYGCAPAPRRTGHQGGTDVMVGLARPPPPTALLNLNEVTSPWLVAEDGCYGSGRG
jgi:hypothetical protein